MPGNLQSMVDREREIELEIAAAVKKLPTDDLVKVMELLVARASVFAQQAQEGSRGATEPVQKALASKVSAHAAGQLVGLNRALLLLKGAWSVDEDAVEAVRDVLGDSYVNTK